MELTEICRSFGLEGSPETAPVGTGHINETCRVSCGGEEYILQSLNTDVFREPDKVERNIAAITSAFAGEESVRVPEWLSAGERLFLRDGERVWRMYRCAAAEDKAEDRERLAGYAFGAFIRIMDRKKRLSCTIDGYHDFERYFSRLKRFAASGSIDSSVFRRLGSLSDTLSDVFSGVPRRNVHGDAKTDNVIIGSVCTVIDLDTAMEGYAALDFGDLIRSVCGSGVPELSRIKAAANGFAAGCGGVLSRAEVDSLYYGILWSTGELAVRYLNDAVSGERYFRNRTPAECLRRADELLGQLSAFINAGDELTGIIYSSFAAAPPAD